MYDYPQTLKKFADLRKLFLEKAKAYGATVRLNAKVVEVRPEDNYLKLASGERVNANVIIGADGPSGLSRNIVIGEEQGGDVSGHMGSMTLHRLVDGNRFRYFSDGNLV